jgi:predicted outer membrane repeat protein
MEKTDYTHTNRLLTFILFSGLMLAVLSCANTVHASPSTIYVNATGGNDSLNGTSWNTAKKTIGNATGTIDPGVTVNIANGNYTGAGNKGITIDRNMTITGQSQTSTIIDAEGSSTIFNMNKVNLTIQKLTLTNSAGGSAIYNYNGGSLTVINSTFTNNTANTAGGAIYSGSIYNYGGSLTVVNSTFTNTHCTRWWCYQK